MDEDDLPILGTEPLVVEFANTLHGGEDFLGTAEAAALWFRAAGAGPVRDTAAARTLRDGIHALFTAAVTGGPAPAAAIGQVNDAAALAPTYPRLLRQPGDVLV